MRLTEKQVNAVKRLMNGEYKEEFGVYLGALSDYAALLNEALIYGNADNPNIVSLEARQGMCRAVVEQIKAIETATQTQVVNTEDTSDGPT